MQQAQRHYTIEDYFVVEAMSPVPLSVDSSNMEIIEVGLSACEGRAGRPLLNSASLERLEALEFAKSKNPAQPALKVTLQDEQHKNIQSWTLQNAWVSKLSGPSLNAKGNEVAIESIEVVCDRIDLA